MKKIISILLVLAILFSCFNQIFSVYAEDKTNVTYPTVRLSFTPTDTALDNIRPIVYISDKTNKKLHAVNYLSGNISSISFDMMPESIYYYKDKIYVSLMSQEHSYYSNPSGAIAIISASNFSLENTFNINIDPFDIVVDDNYIYVSGGSGQLTNICSYSILTKTLASSSSISQKSYIEFNRQLNKIYAVNTDLSPRDIRTYSLSNGTYSGTYDSPYHGDYKMGTLINVSPDGKYLFNNSGNIFTCDTLKANDMKYFSSLTQPYNAIAFNLQSDSFFCANSTSIINYSYSDFIPVSSVPSPGTIKNMFYLEDSSNLATVYSKNVNNITTYYLGVINAPKNIEVLVVEKIDSIPAVVSLEDKYTIKNARDAYNALLENKKNLVTNYNKLVEAEVALKPLLDAETQQTIDKINALTIEVTAQNKTQIQDVRKSYDALLPTQKTDVTNYNKLIEAENKLAIVIGYPQVQLSFTPTDTSLDNIRPIIYISDKTNKKLHAVNYLSGNISSISFDMMPESIYYYKDKIYVSLMSQEHSSNSNSSGAIAIISASNFSLENTFNINIDPFDIVVDDNYIYVSSGSGQWTNICSYSISTKTLVSSSSIRQASYIDFNSQLNKIYAVNTDSTPRDISTFSLSNGTYSETYDSPYHGDYNMGTLINVSPDGKYVFNNSGNIFTCDTLKANDMKYFKSLTQPYNAIAFNLQRDSFFLANSTSIINYSYSDFKPVSSVPSPGTIKNMFYLEDSSNLATIYSKNVNNITTYYLGVINAPKNIEVFMKGDIGYTIENGNAVIAKYTGDETALSIPDSLGGYKVTSIRENAFYNNQSLETVFLPYTIQTIGSQAFASCPNLKVVKMPNTVDNINESAFIDSPNVAIVAYEGSYAGKFASDHNMYFAPLENFYIQENELLAYYGYETNVTIPNSVTSISLFAFYGATSVETINIPSSVTNLSSFGLNFASNLKNINIEEGNGSYKSVDGVVFNNNISSIVCYPISKTETSYKVPATVKSVGEGAFIGSKNLTSIDLPSEITEIGEIAFNSCKNLKSITIPKNVTSIGNGTFAYCTSLTSITIPNSVTSIGNGAFYNCSSLTSITIPESVTSIGNDAFFECKNLKIKCYANSQAETFAKDNNISCEIIKTFTVGDVDNDGSINVSDAVIILQVITGKVDSPAVGSQQFSAIDNNADGNINVEDVLRLLQLITGKISSL